MSQVKATTASTQTFEFMTQDYSPFAINRPLRGHLETLISYWRDLRRGEAEIPFWDDIVLPDVKRLCGDVFLLDVFSGPERFRLNVAEIGLPQAEQDEILGKFIDDVVLPEPLALLRAQSSATVELMRPTLYAHEATPEAPLDYQRLLLPAWGEGQVRMLLGAIERR
ncbi:MAG TPA: hypothetical protein VFW47_08410 [Phenylobacterium sp.]|nr:hypothetical protein [Phenylobacterium sp.]